MIFRSPQFGEIRTAKSETDEPLFCAVDVCKALGYANNRKAIQDHTETEDVTKRDTLTKGGVQQMSFVTESGLYSLIFGSKLETAKQFKKWVTSEVLPTIRKTGGYIATKADDTPEMIMERAILVANSTIEQQKQRLIAQERQIQEQIQTILLQGEDIAMKEKEIDRLNLKANYVDKILANKVLLNTTQIAQDYGMSCIKFNKILKGLRIQRNVNGQWILYAPYITGGYVQSETKYLEDVDKVVTTTKWTQKGRLFLYYTLKARGILPVIEREAI